MHTVVLFGLSVSEFFNLSPFFLELSTTFKDILNFGFLGFFLLLVIRHVLLLLMKPGRLKSQGRGETKTRAPSGQTPLQTGVWVTRKPRKHFIA